MCSGRCERVGWPDFGGQAACCGSQVHKHLPEAITLFAEGSVSADV